MRLEAIVVFVGLACACTCVLLAPPVRSADSKTADSAAPAAEVGPTSARARFQLPKLFDFGRFKSLFKKSYRSLVEELARQKLFLARAFRAFVSAVGYKHGASSSYLGVNQMSDMTPDDIERSKIPRQRFVGGPDSEQPPMGAASPGLLYSEEDQPEGPQLAQAALAAAELGDIERALAEVESRQSEPGYREIAEELRALEATEAGAEEEESSSQASKRQRSKREAKRKHSESGSKFARSHRRLDAGDLMRAPSEVRESPEVRAKMLRRVPSNNPQREQPEFVSFGAELPQGSQQQELGMDGRLALLINKLPGVSYLNSVLSSASTMFGRVMSLDDGDGDDEFMDTAEVMELEPAQAATKLPDEVWADYRTSNCFFQPRSQGQCGSCYAFSAIAYFEYLYCKANGRLVAFSEQYLVDCGQRHSKHIEGCQGAPIKYAADFIKEFGVELRADYPYRMTDDHCPYEPQVGQAQMGYIKLKNNANGYLTLNHFDDYLSKVGPLMFHLQLGPDFRNYGGGVDENLNCQPDDGHAMLLIGHGREDGKEYYLLRNSHSVSWGEGGYYKISKEATRRCALLPFAVAASGWFGAGQRQSVNPRYAGKQHLRRRYKDYLVNGGAGAKKVASTEKPPPSPAEVVVEA